MKYKRVAESNARLQRDSASKYEMSVRRALTDNGIYFEYQYPFVQEDGYWVSDFYIPSIRLVLEIDGPGHMFPSNIEHDNEKDLRAVRDFNCSVARFSNDQAINSPGTVIKFVLGLNVNTPPCIYDNRIFCKTAIKMAFDGPNNGVGVKVDIDGDVKDFFTVSQACEHLGIKTKLVSRFFIDNKDASVFICPSGAKVIRSRTVNENKALTIKKQEGKMLRNLQTVKL
jgi:very-short-patch-repair endonuclease